MVSRLAPEFRAGRWLLLILLLAMVVRLWNIDYPVWKFLDEQNVIDRTLLLGQQGLNPKWFVYPSLFLYLLFVLDGGLYVLGHLFGLFASPEEFATFYFAHPVALTLVGRGVALAAGMACLALTYRLGREGWGPAAGLGAAALLAVSPTFTFSARIAKPDMLMTFFVLLAAWAVARYLETKRARWIRIAGVSIGLGASTKYLAGLGVVWLVAAPWIRGGWRSAVRLGGMAVCLAGAAFLAGTPFAVLDWPTFSAFFAKVAGLMQATWYGAEEQVGYRYYLFDSFPRGIGWPATLVGLAGLGRWLIAGGARERLLAGFVVVYYGWIGSATHVGDLYILPIYPMWALAGADVVAAAVVRLRAARPALSPWAVAGLALIFLAQPLSLNIRDVVLLGARDTRELGGAWIAEHLPPGTRILSEPYGPFVPVSEGRLEETIEAEGRRNPGHGMRLRFEREKAKHGKGFWYYEMELFNDPILGRPVLEEYELDRFLTQGYRVIVLSSGVYGRYRHLPERYPVQNAFYDRVSREGILLARIDPFTPWCCPQSVNERISEGAARMLGRPGPTLLIYRLQEG